MVWQNNGQSIGAMGVLQNQGFHQQQSAQQQYYGQLTIANGYVTDDSTIKLPLKATEALRKMRAAALALRDLDGQYARLSEEQCTLETAIAEEVSKSTIECDVGKLGSLTHQEHRIGRDCNAAYRKRYEARDAIRALRDEFMVALAEADVIPNIP